MRGISLISALRRKFRATSDRALSEKLGNTTPAIHNWKKRKTVTERQLVGLIHSASRAGAAGLRKSALRPVVEFFRIDKQVSKGGASYAIFGTSGEGGGTHPYLQGLRAELAAHHGVYVFFDSRGQAIYAGKARRQSLWKEMNLAFNRQRGEVQSVKRVKHPIRKQPYRTSDEKARQIKDHVVPLHELAAYFSAYQVDDGMINDVEAMLVRSFANNLLNKKMERFGQQRKKKKKARSKGKRSR